jgi:hypothetical protein
MRQMQRAGVIISTGLSVAMLAAGGPSPQAECFDLGLRGVYFVENQGQWSDESVHYGLKSRGLDVAFRESSFTMHLARAVSEHSEQGEPGCVTPTSSAYLTHFSMISPHRSLDHSSDRVRSGSLDHVQYDHLTLTIAFPGSNAVTPRGAQERTTKFNYFVGGEGRGVASNVPSFGAVIYEDLYDGIDLHVCGNDEGVMKYEFHCDSGADYTQIQIHYDGIDSLCVNADGDLEIATTFGTLRDAAPIVWQEGENSKESGGTAVSAVQMVDAELPAGDGRDARSTGIPTIPARFELIDAATYRIALDGPIDSTRPLILDPEVEWMTYLGGSDLDGGYRVAADASGAAFVAGFTTSTDFEGRLNEHHGGHVRDVFVVKATAEGAVEWMTYLGGSAYDECFGIAVDGDGNALLAGNTVSTDFEGRINEHHGGLDDAFVLKLDPDGAVLWMLFIGGSATDFGFGMAVDAQGNSYMAGRSRSTDVEGRTNSHHGGLHDGLIAKVNAVGALQWATYIGGSGVEAAIGIDLDSAGRILTAGYTNSPNFVEATNSYQGGMSDAFIARLSPDGDIQWSTYLGGGERDEGYDVAVMAGDEAIVAAYTDSADFIGRNNTYSFEDGAVVRVNAAGAVQWMTYVGGSGDDGCISVAINSAGHAIVAGYTYSTDFAGRLNDHRGAQDGFVAEISAGGALQWAMLVGGSGLDDAAGIALVGERHAYLSGSTFSVDFESRTNESHGTREAFVSRVRLVDGPQLAVAATCPSGGPIRIEWTGATPGGQVALIYARQTGAFRVPQGNLCAGTQLGLGASQIQLAWQGGAGANGSRTLNASAGSGACGGYMQLLDLTTCSTSNVARVE